MRRPKTAYGKVKVMIVTLLSEVSASRVKVYIDEQPAFVLYKGELRRYNLREGEPLLEKVYEELVCEVLPKRARMRCSNLIKARDYTREQLRAKLKQGGYPEQIIEEALDYAAAEHFIDDLRYAESFITCSHERKSRRRIENDLLQKGIPADTVAKAWRQWESDGNMQDEDEQIKALLVKKHFDAETADRKELQKMYAFLARKGFDGDKIRKALLK